MLISMQYNIMLSDLINSSTLDDYLFKISQLINNLNNLKKNM